MDSISVLAGIGYQLDKPGQPKTFDAPPDQQKKTTGNEVSLLLGQTITNSPAAAHSTAVTIEYRKGLLQNLDWSLSWLYEGNNNLIHRHGIASQLWVVKAFLDEQMTVGFGAGAYVALDHLAGQNRDGDQVISAIGTLTASYRFDSHWSLRILWNRIVTNYNRDADVLLGGIGYRF